LQGTLHIAVRHIRTDMRRDTYPFSGHVFVFRGKRGDLLKVLWWSGDGLCLLMKRLEKGRFVWPQADSGTVCLSPAQLSMLLEGIDWRRPSRTARPSSAL
jgi:transposase